MKKLLSCSFVIFFLLSIGSCDRRNERDCYVSVYLKNNSSENIYVKPSFPRGCKQGSDSFDERPTEKRVASGREELLFHDNYPRDFHNPLKEEEAWKHIKTLYPESFIDVYRGEFEDSNDPNDFIGRLYLEDADYEIGYSQDAIMLSSSTLVTINYNEIEE